MKVIVVENNYKEKEINSCPSWYIVADSAISNAGKPFYVPDEFGEVTVSLSIAVRFCRLGKSISSKFAPRYYKEMAPSVHFQLQSLKNSLVAIGESFSPAVSFDRSIMVGDYTPTDELPNDFTLKLNLNGQEAEIFNLNETRETLDDVISRFSRMNTIKMGDVMLPALGNPIIIKEGDFIEVSGDVFSPLTVKVK